MTQLLRSLSFMQQFDLHDFRSPIYPFYRTFSIYSHASIKTFKGIFVIKFNRCTILLLLTKGNITKFNQYKTC